MLVLSVEIAAQMYYLPWKQVGFASSAHIIMLLLPFVLAVTFGVVLVAKSNLFAKWAASPEGENKENVPGVKGIEAQSFSVLGVAVFVSAIVGLVSLITMLMIPRTVGLRMPQAVFAFQAYWPLLAACLIELAIGAYLFFGVGSISRFWHRIQLWRHIQESRMPPLTREQKS